MFGGAVSAVLFNAADTHLKTDPEARKLNQPDVYKMHIQSLRPCQMTEITLTVKPIKLGPLLSTFQVELTQKDKLRCLALVTAGNFDNSTGPTMKTDWKLHPEPEPKPDFKAVEANRPDPNWTAFTYTGDVIPITGRFLILGPRVGFTTEGVADAWYKIADGKENFHATFIALMSDIMTSMSDTLLHNHGLYDGHNNLRRATRFAADNPGLIPSRLENTLAWAMNSEVFNYTVTLDVEFRRKVTEEEALRWVFVRTTTDKCVDGRMYVENMVYDEGMELVCATRQLILVLEAKRKFEGGGGKAKASL